MMSMKSKKAARVIARTVVKENNNFTGKRTYLKERDRVEYLALEFIGDSKTVDCEEISDVSTRVENIYKARIEFENNSTFDNCQAEVSRVIAREIVKEKGNYTGKRTYLAERDKVRAIALNTFEQLGKKDKFRDWYVIDDEMKAEAKEITKQRYESGEVCKMDSGVELCEIFAKALGEAIIDYANNKEEKTNDEN